MLILLSFAFLAGIVTVLSPCILPVLPIVLAGSVTGGKKRPLGIVTGFILSFTFFTLFSFALLKTFDISPDVLRITAAIVLALFGLSLVIPQIQTGLEKIFSKLMQKSPTATRKEGFWGGIWVGLSLGLFWTPCVGPILASVITLAATSTVTIEAILITLAYALGTAVPMFFIIYAGRKALSKIPWVTNNLGKIQKVFGGIMILLALALFFQLDRKFQSFILDVFPQYGAGLTQLEDTEAVQRELERFKRKDEANENEEEQKQSSLLETLTTPQYRSAPNPNFDGATQWVNSEPLTLEGLRGKVVLVNFWTYGCINCQRTLPYITSWYETYKDDGFVVIGVHTPEFAFEQSTANVRSALAEHGITYPVVQDNERVIWKSYDNHYWPAEYFLDKNGNIRRKHFGEGKYEESEKFIQELLAEQI